jgi:hypothetical protein
MFRASFVALVILSAASRDAVSESVPNTGAINFEIESVEAIRIPDENDAKHFHAVLRVNLLTNSDLVELSRRHGRDVHVAMAACTEMPIYLIHNMYQFDPPIFDSTGKVTADRKEDSGDTSNGNLPKPYHLYLPIQQDGRRMLLRAGYAGYPVPNNSDDLCLQILGTSRNFYSNEVHVPRAAINGAIEGLKLR